MVTSFVKFFIEESHKKMRLHQLWESDLNKLCSLVHTTPVNIVPPVFNPRQYEPYKNPKLLCIYPAKAGMKDYLEKTAQFTESIHGIKNHVVFEVKGTKNNIICCFYGEYSDIEIIAASYRTYFYNSITEIIEPKNAIKKGRFVCYDFLPNSTFYKSLSSYKTFIVSPINLIPQLLSNINEDQEGFYQVLFSPLPGDTHKLIEESVDSDWKASLGADHMIPPSLQLNEASKRLGYKSQEHRNFYSVNFRIILPIDTLFPSVKAFIANYHRFQK